MSFLFKLTIAILIVFAILFPILISSDNKLSALFWKIPKDFWVFLIIMYGAIITVVFIESSEQARIRRQQYLQQYKMPNEIHENVVIAKWHLNRSQFGIRIDHDLASISDHSLASQSITIWHASDH
ncbi:TPA: hypothetical protein ACM5DQ_004738 [Escherichia coli]